MADLNPLIRLRRFRLEEKQRALAVLYAEVDRLETLRRGILDSVEAERDTTDLDIGNPIMMQALMAFIQKSKIEVEVINRQISSQEIKIARAIDEMRDAFGEMKKIEITRDRRLAEIAEDNKRREDALFSETALEIYRRSR